MPQLLLGRFLSGLGGSGMMTMVMIIIAGELLDVRIQLVRSSNDLEYGVARYHAISQRCGHEKLCKSGSDCGEKLRRTDWRVPI